MQKKQIALTSQVIGLLLIGLTCIRKLQLPATLFAAFLAFSLFAVITEGPLGFWQNHIQNAWGNQVWFDLLLAIGISWVFILPRAKAQSMRLPLWLMAICFTGCVGVLAMVARLLWLESKSTGANTSTAYMSGRES